MAFVFVWATLVGWEGRAPPHVCFSHYRGSDAGCRFWNAVIAFPAKLTNVAAGKAGPDVLAQFVYF